MIQKLILIFIMGLSLSLTNDHLTQKNQQVLEDQIESGFIFFGEQSFYGLNINTAPGELRFRIIKSGAFRVFLIESEINDQIKTLAGLNNTGRFIAAQTLLNGTQSSVDINYHNSFMLNFLTNDNITNIPQWLATKENIQRLSGEKYLAAVLPSQGGIIEITDTTYDFFAGEDNFEVLLPIPYEKYTVKQTDQFDGPYYYGMYQFLEFEILENINNPNLNTHFAMAHRIKNNPTDSVTVLFSPYRNHIYITINNDPSKIWMINVDGATIETYEGFDQLHKGNLPAIGITSKDLSILNFSNESLMVGIIFATIVILMIIGVAVFVNVRRQNKDKRAG